MRKTEFGNLSKGTRNGYKYITTRKEGNHGKCYHRLVLEKKLGRPIKDGYVCHHLDGNRENNDENNLIEISESEHMRLHNIIEVKVSKLCPICNKVFYFDKKKHGCLSTFNKRIYCSYDCSNKEPRNQSIYKLDDAIVFYIKREFLTLYYGQVKYLTDFINGLGYNVDKSTVHSIKSGKSWKHIIPEAIL